MRMHTQRKVNCNVHVGLFVIKNIKWVIVIEIDEIKVIINLYINKLIN